MLKPTEGSYKGKIGKGLNACLFGFQEQDHQNCDREDKTCRSSVGFVKVITGGKAKELRKKEK